MSGGKIHYYFGDGKGKTTAAIGLAIRAAGYGDVVIVQFLKNTVSGELLTLQKLKNITVLRGKAGESFTKNMTDEELRLTEGIHEKNLLAGMRLSQSPDCRLLVLDEADDAVALGVLNEQLLKKAILEKPEQLEIVVTGHRPLAWLVNAADYITEMKKHRHPYDKGTAAREGVEF